MLLHILSVVVGTAIVATVLLSALQTVVLPKGGLTGITRFVFASRRPHVHPSPRPAGPVRLGGAVRPGVAGHAARWRGPRS